MEKGFLINRNESFNINGKYNGFKPEINGFTSNVPVAYYNSFSLDSTEEETTWHRMRIKLTVSKETRMNTCVYSSDTLQSPMEAVEYFQEIKGVAGEGKTLDEMISELTPEQGNKMFTMIAKENHKNIFDILLYGIKGRYFWFSIRMHSYEEHNSVIESIAIEFPINSFNGYLPQIYRREQNDFMARFISIFQSIYLDLETQITTMPRKYNIKITDDAFINWIAQWFGIDDSYIWGKKRLKELLSDILPLYQCKGTIASIKQIVKLFLGVEPIIIERFRITDNEFYRGNSKTVDSLFGDNDYVFTMIVESKNLFEPTGFPELLKIVNKFKPIEMICNPVALKQIIYLNHHCYLGINTTLYENQAVVLDEKHSLSSTAIYGGNYE